MVIPLQYVSMRTMADRLAASRLEAGFRSARSAALRYGWNEVTYRSHEKGGREFDFEAAKRYGRAFKKDPVWLLLGVERRENNSVPIVGRIGTGAVIEPDFEQVPPEGLEEIELPIPVSEDMIGFEVVGTSMYPRYSAGDVVVCWRERGIGIESFLRQELAVRTTDGRRYLKEVRPGRRKGTFDLHSFNGPEIESVRIEWFSPIYAIVRAASISRLARDAARAAGQEVSAKTGG